MRRFSWPCGVAEDQMLVVVAGAVSRDDGGAQAWGAPSRGGRPCGLRAGGSGAIGWAGALLIGLLVVVGAVVRDPAPVLDAEQVGEVAAPLLGLPGVFEQLPVAACLSWDGGGGSDESRAAGGGGRRGEGRGTVAVVAPGGREQGGLGGGAGVGAGSGACVVASGASTSVRVATGWAIAADAGWTSPAACLVAMHCDGAATAGGGGPAAWAAAARPRCSVRCAAA